MDELLLPVLPLTVESKRPAVEHADSATGGLAARDRHDTERTLRTDGDGLRTISDKALAYRTNCVGNPTAPSLTWLYLSVQTNTQHT